MTLLRPLNTMARSFHGQGRAMSSNAGGMTALVLAASIACSAAALASPAVAASRGIPLSDIAAGKGGFVIDGQCAYYAFPNTVRRHQLIVDGNAGDAATFAQGTWKKAGTAFKNGHTYIVYNSLAGRSQVLVNSEVTRIGLPLHERVRTRSDAKRL
jgi:hypothetical protein